MMHFYPKMLRLKKSRRRFSTFSVAVALTLAADPVAFGEPIAKNQSDAILASLLKKPAKSVFGAMHGPVPMAARAIGTYARGCLIGGQALPISGPDWQVMRASRNRNWAHPDLIKLLERLSHDAKTNDGWNGLMIGDIAQPRGGPMLTGHASHQIGLDADVWFTPMPSHPLSANERESLTPQEMVLDRHRINPATWTDAQARLVKRAASYPEVTRIFVNPPIKAELCKWATGDRAWLAKVRPYYGHTFHFHVRIACPKNSPNCEDQPLPNPKDGTGCGTELAYWFSDKPWYWIEHPDLQSKIPKPPLLLSSLPKACQSIAVTPSAGSPSQ